MKEYERQVFWLEYFNSELKRREGRRVPLSSATRVPTLSELEEATRRLNLQPQSQPARHPGAPLRESGYVSVRKEGSKQRLLIKIAKELSIVRGRGLGQKASAQKKHGKPAKP